MNRHILMKVTSVILLVAFVFTSCTPAYRYDKYYTPEHKYHIEPISEADKWIDGKAYLANESDSIVVNVCFNQQVQELSNHYLEFNVVIENVSTKPVLVDPNEFLIVTDSPTKTCGSIDPEKRISEIDDYLAGKTIPVSEDKSRSKSTAIVIGTVIVLLVVGIFVLIANVFDDDNYDDEDKDDHDHYYYDDDDEETEELRKIRTSREYQIKMEKLAGIKNVWDKETIRKTTLEPNQSISGKVFFPVPDKMKSLTLFVVIAEYKTGFLFKAA